MQIVCTPSSTRVSAGGWISVDGQPIYDLGWLPQGLGVILFPRGSNPVVFKEGEDLAFRQFVADWVGNRRKENSNE